MAGAPGTVISDNGHNTGLSEMKFEVLFRLLSEKKFFVFSFEELRIFYPQEKPDSLKKHLFRWKNKGWISGLRKGLYELAFPDDMKIPDMFLANKIYSPSYVSLETALSNYGIIPEVSMAVVSVTGKATRRFKNRHGLFLYRTVQPDAFCGYRIENHNGFDVLIAEPEKALADYLYFKTLRVTGFDFDAERLDRKIIRKLNSKTLQAYASIYGLDLRKILYAHL